MGQPYKPLQAQLKRHLTTRHDMTKEAATRFVSLWMACNLQYTEALNFLEGRASLPHYEGMTEYARLRRDNGGEAREDCNRCRGWGTLWLDTPRYLDADDPDDRDTWHRHLTGQALLPDSDLIPARALPTGQFATGKCFPCDGTGWRYRADNTLDSKRDIILDLIADKKWFDTDTIPSEDIDKATLRDRMLYGRTRTSITTHHHTPDREPYAETRNRYGD